MSEKREFPILNGKLLSDLDLNGHKLLGLDIPEGGGGGGGGGVDVVAEIKGKAIEPSSVSLKKNYRTVTSSVDYPFSIIEEGPLIHKEFNIIPERSDVVWEIIAEESTNDRVESTYRGRGFALQHTNLRNNEVRSLGADIRDGQVVYSGPEGEVEVPLHQWISGISALAGKSPTGVNIYKNETINVENGGFYNIWSPCALALPCVTRNPNKYQSSVNPDNGNVYGIPIRFLIRVASDSVKLEDIVFMDDAGRMMVNNLSEDSYAQGMMSARPLNLSKRWKTVTMSVFPTDIGTEIVHLEVV